jgi:hypothetical protein
MHETRQKLMGIWAWASGERRREYKERHQSVLAALVAARAEVERIVKQDSRR